MKIFALAIVLLFCIVQNTSATWQNDVKISHWQQINDIINRQLANIRAAAARKGTPAANQCAEQARLQLRDITNRGYNDVSRCIRSSNTAGIAHVCAQQIDSRVFQEAFDVSRTANTCINNA